MNRLLALTLVASLGMVACDSNDADDNAKLRLSFTNLAPLEGGLTYEGWAIVGGSPVSTGKFNVDANGAIVSTSGSAISNGEFEVATDISAATAVVISIEPAGDNDTVPSSTKMLGGDVANGSTNLAVSHGSSLGDDFSSVAGTYILATPTAGNADNPTSGVWFLDPTGPIASLTLPTLPTGWKYEGWAVTAGGPVSTGTFLTASGADEFSGFSGPNAGPAYPGEDLLINAPAGQTFPVDLSGATIVISVEPSPDDSAAPFALKPLVGNAPAAAAPGTSYDLGQNLGSLVTGSASIL